MPGSPTQPLQAAIYTRLSADATLVTTLGCDVYDDVPEADPSVTPYPYVAFGSFTETMNDTMGTTGRDVTVTVHSWSEALGFKEVQTIDNRVDALLHRWQPTVTGWSATHLLQEYGEVVRDDADPNKPLRHGIRRYRLYLNQ